MSLKEELKALLKKHNCSIEWGFDDCTDTHGIYDERVEIVENKTDKVLLSVPGMSLSSCDIE